jgi:autotransporter-associated beta strand protein
MSYNFASSEVKLWLNPNPLGNNATMPTPTLYSTNSNPSDGTGGPLGNPPTLQALVLISGSSQALCTNLIDEIRVNTNWAGVTPAALPAGHIYNVTGGGTNCPPSAGFSVGLDGSDLATSNVTYLLLTNSVYSGLAVAGNGSPITFGSAFTGNGIYTVMATNTTQGVSMMNGNAEIFIPVSPAIVTQPVPVTVATGGMGVFSVVATGDELGYQWYQNGTPLVDGSPISGSQTANLVISPATTSTTGYYVIVNNSCGYSVTSTTNGLTLDTAANLTWRGNLSTYMTTNSITSVVTTNFSGTNNLWDVGMTADWTNGTAAVVFNSGDNVTFDDTALTNVVNLTNSYLAPSSIKVTANSKIYTFITKNNGSIVGASSLIMSGSSTLTNEVANSYTGGTIITNKGTICLAGGPPALNGLGSGTVTLAGGTLDFGTGLGFSATAGLTNTINVVTPGTAGSSNLIVMEGTGTQGAVLLGTLTGTPGASLTIYESSSMGRLRLYAPFTNSLNINISSYGYVWNKNNIGTPYPTTLQFAPYNTNASQVYNGVISGDGQIIARNSSGSEVIFNNTNTFMGYQYLGAGDPNVSFVLSQCNVGIGTNSITNGTPALNGTNVVSGPLGVGEVMLAVETSASSSSSSGTLFASGGARTLHNLIQYLAGTNMFTFRLGGSNNLTLAGGLELAAPDNSFTNRIIEVDNTALTTESGVIDDGLLTAGHGYGCPITITSSNALGTLVLSATNTYTGPTTVSNGTLLVNGLIGTNTVAAVTVAGGTLGGSGTIRGPVTVLPAGTLAPGTSAIGTLILSNGLTLDGNLLFKVNTSLSPLQSNDEAVVSGTLINGGTGTLTVSNLGTTASLVAGDKFTLFNKALTNGLALTVAGGGTGVTWTNNLAKDGSISVASITVARPVITGMVISSGTNLVFSGTNSTGTAGGTYYVLSSINVASPLSTWTPILTNTFITGGAFSVTNPILPGVPGMFYILELP